MNEPMHVAVVFEGTHIAQFESRAQANSWLDAIVKAGWSARRDAYGIVDLPVSDTSRDATRAVDAYKDRVYEATTSAASDMTCSGVQQFLADVGINPEDYANEYTFTVVIKYDQDTHGEPLAEDVRQAVEQYVGSYEVEVS